MREAFSDDGARKYQYCFWNPENASLYYLLPGGGKKVINKDKAIPGVIPEIVKNGMADYPGFHPLRKEKMKGRMMVVLGPLRRGQLGRSRIAEMEV